eukprot:CAMPEP_0204257492 /NCGR_PEP_ID=MMETSP0468-20130131/4466_1 /ASSEMBLY_ACC=CAM_ASM_000383 /TAXON_ID=2969 /ORGANISM="Oxyrrhis marina" /LENGTH=39 /DNA_ID= /DNA_START= /DNA_END= /DNA_ORIENTATION=
MQNLGKLPALQRATQAQMANFSPTLQSRLSEKQVTSHCR